MAIDAVLAAITTEFEKTYGRIAGAEFAIIALGKAGSREMTFHSDLDLVVVEDYIINAETHKKTRQPTAYEGIGAVRYWAAAQGVACEAINAGGHKPFSGVKKPMAQSKIIRLGWTKRTKDRHAEDACSLVLWGLRHHDRETFAALMRQIASAS